MTFYHLYADESRQQGHPFMLYGLLLIPRGIPEQELRQRCSQLRDQHHWGQGEFKWEKVSRSKLDIYKKFVDLFFTYGSAEFRCIVVGKSKIDYNAFPRDAAETVFYEFYYQAISLSLRLTNEYLVFTDSRQNRQTNRLADLKLKINHHWLSQGARSSLVRNVEPRDSKVEDLMQIVDVLLGAVGYDVEERTESPAKVEMVQHIAERIGCERLSKHQGKETRFSIKNIRFMET